MTAPIRITPELPIVRTMQDVVDVFRIMKEHWGLTNGFCDDVGGLTPGHTDKILGPTEDKRLGYDTFALFMSLCALELVPRIDMDAVKRMDGVWEQRAPRWFKDAKIGRVSKKLIERAKPHVFRDAGRAGGLKRATCLAAKQVERISRKGGKSRAKSLSKARRSAIARTAGLASAAKRSRLAALAAIAAAEAGSICAIGDASAPAVTAMLTFDGAE